MSISYRAYLVFGGLLLTVAATGAACVRLVAAPTFAELEREEAREEVSRCVWALDQQALDLQRTCLDWSRWDDTYRFINDRNAAYTDSNLHSGTMETLGLNLMYLCDLQGRAIWSATRHPTSGESAPLADFPTTGLPREHRLLRAAEAEGVHGVWSTAWGPMVVASASVTTSDRLARPNGFWIMGRVAAGECAADLGRRLQLDTAAWGVDDPNWGPEQEAAARQLPRAEDTWVTDTPDGRSAAYRLVPNLEGRPALLFRVTIRKSITQRGRAAIQTIGVSMGAATLGLLALTSALMRRTVIAPIVALTEQAVAVTRTGAPTAALPTDRRDEIGVLARQFDAMLARLGETQARLLRRSYQEGMGEMAAGVLHNIRNTLSPAVVDLEEAGERLRSARPDRMAAAAAELARDDAPSARRGDLAAYVQLAGTRFLEALSAAEGHVQAALRQIGALERMLPDRAALGTAEPAPEVVSTAELVEHASLVLPRTVQETLELEVGPSVAAARAVRVVPLVAEHVLANVLANAAESRPDRPVRVRVEASLAAEDGRAFVDLQFTDDGPGLAEEASQRAFEPGFTTKARGWGLGLHWCANAMHAIGGRIHADPAEPGRGACLHLLLPAVDESERGS